VFGSDAKEEDPIITPRAEKIIGIIDESISDLVSFEM